jgi:crotonobetainyl-CoA:carnitine CoA-transferase CaiB-like acyl-CoA transferase
MDKPMTKRKLLSSYRALDLTDNKGWFCGRILADLGVDVIKIEPPQGDPGRKIGPFYHNQNDPEKNLTWFTNNLGKRGITLDLNLPEGRVIFGKLVNTADFVLESFSPGYLASLELDFNYLKKINPKVILVSISPFGQDGPYKNYIASDINVMAMGGFMFVNGNSDRAPLRISFPLAYPMACAQAVIGALIALHYRQNSGLGQQVDVSAQECVTNTLTNVIPTWELNHILTHRVGSKFFRGGIGQEVHQRVIWECKDGSIAFMAMGGQSGARSNTALVQWINEDEMANDFLLGIDWNKFSTVTLDKYFINNIETAFEAFFKNHTRQELYQGAQKRGIFLQIVAAPKDILENQQLQERNFWIDINHSELGVAIQYPGAFAKGLETSLEPTSRAPLVGEHNMDIYKNELNISQVDIDDLYNKRII